jgi:hypothetical protein
MKILKSVQCLLYILPELAKIELNGKTVELTSDDIVESPYPISSIEVRTPLKQELKQWTIDPQIKPIARATNQLDVQRVFQAIQNKIPDEADVFQLKVQNLPFSSFADALSAFNDTVDQITLYTRPGGPNDLQSLNFSEAKRIIEATIYTFDPHSYCRFYNHIQGKDENNEPTVIIRFEIFSKFMEIKYLQEFLLDSMMDKRSALRSTQLLGLPFLKNESYQPSITIPCDSMECTERTPIFYPVPNPELCNTCYKENIHRFFETVSIPTVVSNLIQEYAPRDLEITR